MGYGFGVMIPAIMFGGISGNLINPAFTIGLATWGLFPWSEVAPYIVAQMLGAIAGQVAIVVTHKPYYDQTTNPEDILATFSTINAAHSRLNGFLSELLGSVVLFSCALAIITSPLTENEPAVAHLALGFLVWGSSPAWAGRPARRSTRRVTSARGWCTRCCRCGTRGRRSGTTRGCRWRRRSSAGSSVSAAGTCCSADRSAGHIGP
jgi:hypothetical protein